MKKIASIFMLTLALLFTVDAVSAQDTEVYTGYQFVRVNPDVQNPEFRFNQQTDTNGFNVSVTGYPSRNLGLIGEVASNFGDNANLSTYMVGATLKSKGRVQPFIRGLAGVSRLRVGNSSDVDFSFAAGTGFDVRVNEHFGVRVVQADYLNTRNFGDVNHNLRLSSGLTFTF